MYYIEIYSILMLIISGKIYETNLKSDYCGRKWWHVKGDSAFCISKPSPKTHSESMHNTSKNM